MPRKILRAVAVLLISSVVVPVGVAATLLGALLFLPLPATLPEAKPTVESQISHVFDATGNEIAVFREFETSIPVRPEDIPLHLRQAVISAEDRNFYQHSGVDVRGTVRALWADIRGQRLSQGGSTITQQYVRNVFPEVGTERTITRKIREAVLASRLSRQVNKDDVLYKYLTTVYLGEGTYGVGAAAESYFRKPVSQLTISEAALLAGLIPAPSRYEPRGNPDGAENKRRLVLRQMHSEGYLTDAQLQEAYGQGLWFASAGPPPGPATLIHPAPTQRTAYPYFVDYVRRYLLARFGRNLVYRGGLQIQTTLDPRLQAHAEKTVAKALDGTAPPLEMALATVEPPTGFVKALVGGRDFYAPSGQVNLALGGCPRPDEATRAVTEVEATCWDRDAGSVVGGGTGRQPGSSFKPFVLAAAFNKGISPTRVYAAPNEYRIPGCRSPKGCTIQNYEGASFGRSDLRRATWKSINTVYAQLTRDVGVADVARMARQLGIDSAYYSPRVHGISYGLGALEVAPLDMASAYGVFAARGLRAPPTPIVKVIDARGQVLIDNTRAQPQRVLEEVIADNVTDVLKGVISSGTGTRANINRPAAGKTGTAQEWRDAWFVGYTPTLSTAVWMGFSDLPRTMAGIKGVRRVAGGTIPAATWHDFMAVAVEGVPATEFSEPAPIKPIADELKRRARGGFDPGPVVEPEETKADCDGPCEVAPKPPRARTPVPPTTAVAAVRPTTNTLLPPVVRDE